MGTCCTKNSEFHKDPDSPIRLLALAPHMFIKSNFRLFDYTLTIGEPSNIDELETRIGDYVPNDIRCMRDSEDSLAQHSYVVIGTTSPETGKDIGMMIKFSVRGFKLTMAEIDFLPNSQFVHIEQIHLPQADSKKKGGLRDIVRWTYEHKDELYVDPWSTPELNMGSRVFEYVRSLLK